MFGAPTLCTSPRTCPLGCGLYCTRSGSVVLGSLAGYVDTGTDRSSETVGQAEVGRSSKVKCAST